MEVFTILCIVLLVLTLLYYKKWMNRHTLDLDKIPGPRGLPFIGSGISLMGCPLHEVFREWAQKYGGVFKVKVFGSDVVVLSDRASIQEALMTRGKDFADRPYKFPKSIFKNWQQPATGIITGDYDPRWKAQRKAVHKALKLYGSGLSKFEDSLRLAINDLVQAFTDTDGQHFDPFGDIYDVIAVFIVTLLTGRHYQKDSPLVNFMKTVEDSVARAGGGGSSPFAMLILSFPFLLYLPSFKRTWNGLLETERIMVRDYILPMKETEEFKAGKGMLVDMYQMQEEFMSSSKHERFEMNDIHVMAMSRDVMRAGTMTTMTTTYAFLNLLLHFPDVQDSMVAEIGKVLGGGERTVTLEYKDKMPYARATVLELLRLSNVIPLMVPHATRVDTEVQGYRIPANTMVFINSWAYHHSDKEWDDPWGFHPERFLDSEGHLVDADHPDRRKLMVFGAGPRLCVGETLALNRLFLIIVTLVQSFNFCPPDGERLVPYDPRTHVFGTVNTPLPYKLRALPRKWNNE